MKDLNRHGGHSVSSSVYGSLAKTDGEDRESEGLKEDRDTGTERLAMRTKKETEGKINRAQTTEARSAPFPFSSQFP